MDAFAESVYERYMYSVWYGCLDIKSVRVNIDVVLVITHSFMYASFMYSSVRDMRDVSS